MLNKFGKPIIKAEWLVTRACNLFCSYCEIAHKNVPELDIEKKKQIATKLKEWDVFPVIYGGEVTLSRDFEKLLEHLHTLDFHYALISHGLVNLSKLERWVELYKIPNWSVSVDTLRFNSSSMDPDVIRKSRAGLATLLFTKDLIPDRVSCTTITKYNIDEIPDIVAALSAMGVYTILSLVNQYKPGFRYSAPASNQMVPSQSKLEKLFAKLKSMRAEIETEEKYVPLGSDLDKALQEGFSPIHNSYIYEGKKTYPSKRTLLKRTKPKYLFHDPEEVWDLALQYGVNANWKCSRLSKLTIDADGTLGCCVDWKGDNYGSINFLDVTDENFSAIEEMFHKDISSCHNSTGGCAWFPTMLTENFQDQGEKGLEMIRHGF